MLQILLDDRDGKNLLDRLQANFPERRHGYICSVPTANSTSHND
jgi:hypothetical protein